MLAVSFLTAAFIKITNRMSRIMGSAIHLGRMMIAKAVARIGQGFLPVAIASLSGRRLRKHCAGSILAMLSRRIPKVFIAKHNIVKCKITGNTTNKVDVHNVNNDPGARILILVSKRPRCVKVVKRPLPSTCRSTVTRGVRIMHKPTSMLCNSGTVTNIVGVIAGGRRRSKIRACNHTVCNSCGAFGTRTRGTFQQGNFDSFISLGCGHASKRHRGSRFSRCKKCTGLKCRFSSR